MVRTLTCCAVVLLATLAACTARANDSRAQAAAHYSKGIELAEQGRFAAALEQFRAAYDKSPHFAVLYNIGQAEMALGKPIEAIEALTRYLRDGAEQVPLSRREQVQAQVALLESRLAELSVTTDRPGALVNVDGRDVGKTPLFQPLRMAAGTHTVSVTIEHIAPLIRTIVLREGERQSLAFVVPVALAPPPPPAPVPTAANIVAAPQPADGLRNLRLVAYVAAGAGAAAGGVALGVYLWNRDRYEDWQATNASLHELPPGSAAYRDAAIANNARADSLTSANRTILGFSIVSGVLVATGVTLYAIDRAIHRTGADPAQPRVADGGISLDVAVGPGGAACAGWTGRW